MINCYLGAQLRQKVRYSLSVPFSTVRSVAPFSSLGIPTNNLSKEVVQNG